MLQINVALYAIQLVTHRTARPAAVLQQTDWQKPSARYCIQCV